MCDKRQASLGVSEGAGLARAWRQATEHSTGVLTLQHHGEALQEAIRFNPRTIARARRDQARELAPGRRSRWTPTTAACLGNKRDELEAFSFAVLLCLEVGALARLVGFSRGYAGARGLRQDGSCTEAGSDGKVKCGGAMQAPLRNPYIRWAAMPGAPATILSTITIRSQGKQARLLDLNPKPSSLHSSSNHGPETVMALDSIPATWAATRMVAKAVSDTVAQGAMRVFRRDGDPCIPLSYGPQ